MVRWAWAQLRAYHANGALVELAFAGSPVQVWPWPAEAKTGAAPFKGCIDGAAPALFLRVQAEQDVAGLLPAGVNGEVYSHFLLARRSDTALDPVIAVEDSALVAEQRTQLIDSFAALVFGDDGRLQEAPAVCLRCAEWAMRSVQAWQEARGDGGSASKAHCYDCGGRLQLWWDGNWYKCTGVDESEISNHMQASAAGAGEARAVPPIGLQGGKSYTLHECCTCKHDDDIAMRDADSDDGAGGDNNDLGGDGMLCE